MHYLYRIAVIVLMLVMSGILMISNVAIANVDGISTHEYHSMTTAISDNIMSEGEDLSHHCADRCCDHDIDRCMEHCETYNPALVSLQPLLAFQKNIIPPLIYEERAYDNPLLVGLKPPQKDRY